MDAAGPIKSDAHPVATGLDSGSGDDEALAGVEVLVEQMTAAGDWPDPALLEKILETGDDAVEPLFAIVRTTGAKNYEPGPVSHAIGLLSILRPPAAIAELAAVIKRDAAEVGPDAAYALSKFGAPGFDALLELCSDPAISVVDRCDLYGAAREAAGDDQVLRSRIAEFMRASLDDRMATAREEQRLRPPGDDASDDEIDERSVLFSVHDDQEGLDDESFEEDFLDDDELLDDDESDLDDDLVDEERDVADDDGLDDELDESDDYDDIDDDDDSDIVFTTAEEIGFLVAGLACLADPLAADLIETAFREKLVDREVVSRGYVEKKYKSGGESPQVDLKEDWLGEYRVDHESYLESLNRRAGALRAPKLRDEPDDDWDDDDWDDEPESLPATATIRNTRPKLGRNDPCWCGSGKKYKKCHLGKDGSV